MNVYSMCNNMIQLFHVAQSQLTPSPSTDPSQQLKKVLNVDQFKSKYLFKPFEYEERLEQTLTHDLDALNGRIPSKPNLNNHHPMKNSQVTQKEIFIIDSNNLKNNNVRFEEFNNLESFDSTSKSIKTNNTIVLGNNINFQPDQLNQKQQDLIVNESKKILNKNNQKEKHFLNRPPNLIKKTISFVSNVKGQLVSQQSSQMGSFVQSDNSKVFNYRNMKKKGFATNSKSKYEEEQMVRSYSLNKNQNDNNVKNISSKSSYINIIGEEKICFTNAISNFNSNNTTNLNSNNALAINNAVNSYTNTNRNNSSTPMSGQSLYQPINHGTTAQNFLRFSHQAVNSQNLAVSASQVYSSKATLVEPISFNDFCMLLFSQTPKSVPCSVNIIDTLFYYASTESKESKQIVYVFKDKKRNLLMKMKNKNKSAYELFVKRRMQYQISNAKQDKLKKKGSNDMKSKRILKNSGAKQTSSTTSYNRTINNTISGNNTYSNSTNNTNLSKHVFGHDSKQIELSMKCIQQQGDNNIRMIENIKQKQYKYSIRVEELSSHSKFESSYNQQMNNSSTNKLDNETNINTQKKKFKKTKIIPELDQEQLIQLSQDSKISFAKKITQLSQKSTYKTFLAQKNAKTHQISLIQSTLEHSPVITPFNSCRESHHTLQTSYMALLKYNNNHIIRLKADELKSIFYNPLYANQRLKNTNNTQYIQAFPIQEEMQDLKVYSMHYNYEKFKNDAFFIHVKSSLYKQNDYMNNIHHTGEDCFYDCNRRSTNVFSSLSPQSQTNLLLKKRLKEESIQVYLYYLIFQMYTYVSMHYNMQLLSGVFRFIEYDNDYALFQAENIIVKELPKQAEFIKSKIFAENADEQFKSKNPTSNKLIKETHAVAPAFNYDYSKLPSQTLKKISKQMLNISIQYAHPQSALQKELISYFTEENQKISNEMQQYFTDKIDKIKNIKDINLSKNIFKIINLEESFSHNNVLIDKNTRRQPKQQKEKQLCNPQKEQQLKRSLNTKQQTQMDFHQILNDEKKLQKFLKQKSSNDQYTRKNISNFSVVRLKKQLKKVQDKKNLIDEYRASLDQQRIYKRNKCCSSQIMMSQQKKNMPPFKPVSKLYGFKFFNQIIKKTNFFYLKTKDNINSQLSKNQNYQLVDTCSYQPLKQNKQNDNQLLSKKLGLNDKKLQKKLIKEKYTRWNMNKFSLGGIRANHFM